MCASAAFGASSSAIAQGNFPDTTANHWAYEALSRMKSEGILIGYPDGLFRGSRPMSRYEMAVALNSAYSRIKTRLDEIQTELTSVDAKNGTKMLSDMVASLQDQLNVYKKFGPDLADLKRASDTFELELEQLGVDVEQMKKVLGQLDERVAKLEKKKPTIDIHGDLNFWLGAGTSRNDEYGLNKDGRLIGTSVAGGLPQNADGTPPTFPPVTHGAGFDRDLTILHEAAFTFAGTNERGPKWSATIVETDMFGTFGATSPTVAFGNQSDVFNSANGGNPAATNFLGYASGSEDIYLQQASIDFGGPKGFVDVGRVGYSTNPYMFKRLDNTSYFSNDRWDNGLYYFDGALAGGSVGPAHLTLFGGVNSEVQSLQGVQINPIRSGPIGGILPPTDASGNPVLTQATGTMTFDRLMGGNLKLGIGGSAHLNLGLIVFTGDDPSSTGADNDVTLDANSTMANHLSVYGADGDWRLGPVVLSGGAYKSDIQQTTHTVVGTDNAAWNVKASLDRAAFGVSAEYRQVDPNYVAPGDWGRLGILRNPSNIKGLKLNGHVRFFKRFELSGSGTFDSGLMNSYEDTTYLGTNTSIRGYDAKLSFDLSKKCTLFTELERTQIGNLDPIANYSGSGDPDYRWLTFGLNYHLSQNAFCNVSYEESDIDNDYQLTGGAAFHGGFITSQLTLKF